MPVQAITERIFTQESLMPNPNPFSNLKTLISKEVNQNYFGIWSKTLIDGIQYQEKIRSEWRDENQKNTIF